VLPTPRGRLRAFDARETVLAGILWRLHPGGREAVTCSEGQSAAPTAAQDAKAEHAVLAFLINEHPNQLTVAEVSWALDQNPTEFEAKDAVERAIRELVGTGLLRCADGTSRRRAPPSTTHGWRWVDGHGYLRRRSRYLDYNRVHLS
jgi:hypothetical protein